MLIMKDLIIRKTKALNGGIELLSVSHYIHNAIRALEMLHMVFDTASF
jgi:hypothetical protein